MNTSTPIGKNSEPQLLHEIKAAHTQELQQIAQRLAQMTNLSEETVKPHLDAMLLQLVKSKVERPFYETATPDEWVKAFREWASSHTRDTPLLDDYAVSRAGIYEEDEEI
ncbi:MAG: hypothetical protein HEQ35_26100 [Gloeotrichia echinulata IR180]|jgi:hypothetical protein|nr:hypothetical protein [Gloeotrichia echinulata DEX184]